MEIKLASVDSVIVYFGNTIDKSINQMVKRAYLHLQSLNNKAIKEMIPSYNSLFINYDIFTYDFESIKNFLIDQLGKDLNKKQEEVKLLSIDVYYGEEVGLDLQRVANTHKLSIEEVIELHSKKIYDVYTIGFLPGFAYLGEVDKTIQTPRLDTPRKKISKNSVAIADAQTAIYPIDSPGGWNILGKTAFELIDKNLETLCPIDINTQIKFNPISKEEFIAQGGVL